MGDAAWKQDKLEMQLSPKRKVFVDKAIASGDLAAVLEAMGPCDDTAWRN